MYNVSRCARIGRNNLNLDFHPCVQWNDRPDQRSMEVDNDCLSVADQRFSDTFRLDHHFKLNASTSSGFKRSLRRGHSLPACTSKYTLSAGCTPNANGVLRPNVPTRFRERIGDRRKSNFKIRLRTNRQGEAKGTKCSPVSLANFESLSTYSPSPAKEYVYWHFPKSRKWIAAVR